MSIIKEKVVRNSTKQFFCILHNNLLAKRATSKIAMARVPRTIRITSIAIKTLDKT